MAHQEAKMRKIIDPLKKQPQSGLMINCVAHGTIPITQSEYDKQVEKAECRCPICGAIPRKIWKVVNDKG
jgi:transcription elongation factor Elf1